MSPLDYSRARLQAVLAEIVRLKESEFPYKHSKDALYEVEKLFQGRLDGLKQIPDDRDPATVHARCAESLTILFRFLPLLGFLLRSTNVRNAFELYGPLLQLFQQVIDNRTKLIISSEWENYSPFLRQVSELKEFILIGFPAPESGNPLLIPLAGHELGHAVWKIHSPTRLAEFKEKIEEKLFGDIETILPKYNKNYPGHNAVAGKLKENRRVTEFVGTLSQWSLGQVEEYFCDFVGLYIFDEAYLHSVAYILTPTILGTRTPQNPSASIHNRVASLIEASKLFKQSRGGGYAVPHGYQALFEKQSEPVGIVKFLLHLVDAASSYLVPDLMRFVQEIFRSKSIPPLTESSVKQICASYKFVVPCDMADSLINILSAAWRVYHDDGFWTHMRQLLPEDKQKVLRELVLKNIEVLEIQQIMKLTP